jgi:hypothetical protein
MAVNGHQNAPQYGVGRRHEQFPTPQFWGQKISCWAIFTVGGTAIVGRFPSHYQARVYVAAVSRNHPGGGEMLKQTQAPQSQAAQAFSSISYINSIQMLTAHNNLVCWRGLTALWIVSSWA